MGITDTDFYGSMCYSEAYRARYGGTLKPKYDTQEKLFNQFYDELKKATDDLTNDVVVNVKTISQVSATRTSSTRAMWQSGQSSPTRSNSSSPYVCLMQTLPRLRP